MITAVFIVACITVVLAFLGVYYFLSDREAAAFWIFLITVMSITILCLSCIVMGIENFIDSQ